MRSIPQRYVGLLLVLVSLVGVTPDDTVFADTEADTITMQLFPPSAIPRQSGVELVRLRTDEAGTTYAVRLGSRSLELTAPGYRPTTIALSTARSGIIQAKLEPDSPVIQKAFEIETDPQPKSVRFSPDGRHMVVCELDGDGIAVYDAQTGELVASLALGGTGFVESEFLPHRRELWVSQMTTGLVHVISSDSWQPLGRVHTQGVWPKVILSNRDDSRVYVSNWVSRDISVIDPETRTVVQRLDVGGTPRGLALSADERAIYVAIFSSGFVEKRDTTTGMLLTTLGSQVGAKRHLVVDSRRGRLYASDMATGAIEVFDTTTDQYLTGRWVGEKPNTIDLSPGGHFLYVSDRGPNNAVSYLLPGPAFGRVLMLDAMTLETIAWVWGRNQPTGLAVSPSGSRLAFTDFLDRGLELYSVSVIAAIARTSDRN